MDNSINNILVFSDKIRLFLSNPILFKGDVIQNTRTSTIFIVIFHKILKGNKYYINIVPIKGEDIYIENSDKFVLIENKHSG